MAVFRLIDFRLSFNCVLIVADSVSEGGRLGGAERLFANMVDDAVRAYFVTFDFLHGFLLVLPEAVLESELEVGAIRGEDRGADQS
jgi:hypothetical protein